MSDTLEPNRTNDDQRLPDYLNLPQGLALTDLVIRASSRRHGDFNPIASGAAMTPAQMKLYLAAPTVARLGGWGKGGGGWDDFVLYSRDTNTTKPMGVGGLVVLPADVTSAQLLAGGARTSSPTTLAFPPGLSEIAFGTPTQSTGVIGGYALYGDTDFGLNARRRDSTGALTGGFGLSASGDMVMRDNAGLNKGGLSKGRFRGLEQTGASATSDPPPTGYMDFFPDSTTGHASRVNSAGVVVDLEAGGGLPSRHVSGLVIRYAGIDSITVTAGKARNKLDTADMTLSALTTVSLNALAINNLEAKVVSAANCAVSIGSAVITGTGTSFKTAFQSRVLTGTSNTVTASTTVTGTSTLYLSECAVGDMYGNTTGGFSRITAIASDTSMTVASALTLANGAAVSLIEGSSVYLDGLAGGAVGTMSIISSDTSITCAATFGSNKSSKDLYHGWGGQVSQWLAVWLVSGSSGTGVVISNQRTTPYVTSGSAAVTPTGYATSYRRIGWVRIDASVHVDNHFGLDGGFVRWVHVPESIAVSNAASTTTPAGFVVDTSAPPTARRVMLSLQSASPNTVDYVGVMSREHQAVNGFFTPTLYEIFCRAPSTSLVFATTGLVTCDGAQGLCHFSAAGSTGDGTYCSILGYEDTLE